jgi:hypothetical protein
VLLKEQETMNVMANGALRQAQDKLRAVGPSVAQLQIATPQSVGSR